MDRARQYFGYDESFLNDQAICDEIDELRFSKDFTFLDEFFSSEGGASGGSDPGEYAGDYEEVEVEDIDVEGVFFKELTLPEIPAFDMGDIPTREFSCDDLFPQLVLVVDS